MKEKSRDKFSSNIGFVMAAAGSAIGIGNIWGFPTKAAENGGGVFILLYLFLVLLLGFPMILSEMAIGRFGQSHPTGSLKKVSSGKMSHTAAFFIGGASIVAAISIFSFYTIISGWFLAFTCEPILRILNLHTVADWCITDSIGRNIFFALIFSLMTLFVVIQGVEKGIEKWSKRLMPILFMALFIMIVFMFTQKGALEGVKRYLIPNFSKGFDSTIIISSLGQVFFSLSLGVGCILIYGSYLNLNQSLPKLALHITLLDTAVAFLAGLLIIPSMFVAQEFGVQIFSPEGVLLDSNNLVFNVLPQLFEKLGVMHYPMTFLFFSLLVVAALTSAVSVLEIPVAFTSEELKCDRKISTIIATLIASFFSILIACSHVNVFNAVVKITTQYAQPLVGLGFTIYVGWMWKRSSVLREICNDNEKLANSLLMKFWHFHIKFICPIIILSIIIFSIFQK